MGNTVEKYLPFFENIKEIYLIETFIARQKVDSTFFNYAKTAGDFSECSTMDKLKC